MAETRDGALWLERYKLTIGDVTWTESELGDSKQLAIEIHNHRTQQVVRFETDRVQNNLFMTLVQVLHMRKLA